MTNILQSMNSNMRFYMTYFANSISTMELIPEPDVIVVRSKISDDTFNYVIFAKFTKENVLEKATHIIQLFKTQNLPFSWWIGESDSPSTLSNTLLNLGLTFKEQDAGMFLALENFSNASFETPPLEFQKIHSLQGLKDFSQVLIDLGGNVQIFDLIYKKIPLHLLQKDSPFEMHIAYLDKKPIVTGILVFHENVAGIYYIATVKNQRKKGYGTAMMQYLLNRAKTKGFSSAVLQSSHEGKNLYQRLGFTQCCVFNEYSWNPKKS